MKGLLTLTHPLHLVVGLTIWSIWFVTIYGGLSVACSVAPPAPEQDAMTYINVSVGVLTLLTMALLSWLTWASYRAGQRVMGRERFMATVSSGIYLFTTFATLFTAAPIIGLPPCL
ncbi:MULTISPECIES: hypothetical protein [Halomonadaceae]|uniref:hypothetical protein n=1 Tax=Halomonadaceae TaxID=28256 RepID=UPI00159B79E5|nr:MULTISPECIES: hypothetical protein [Halomonas]QJQ94750.1 hypothetical protein HIO72_05255 [Halomonas sp. PA5]